MQENKRVEILDLLKQIEKNSKDLLEKTIEIQNIRIKEINILIEKVKK